MGRQHGTLVNGTNDQNLQSRGGLISTHTQFTTRFVVDPFAFSTPAVVWTQSPKVLDFARSKSSGLGLEKQGPHGLPLTRLATWHGHVLPGLC